MEMCSWRCVRGRCSREVFEGDVRKASGKGKKILQEYLGAPKGRVSGLLRAS